MKYKEFTDSLKMQISALPFARQLDFAITICKRLYFDYQKFYNYEEWGNPELLMDAIKFCEQAKKVSPIKSEIETWLIKVEAITPDTEDFGDELGSYALNACIAVLHTLQFLLTKDAADIFYIGNALYETMDVKVQEDQDLSEEQIDQHPLMQETKQFLLEQSK